MQISAADWALSPFWGTMIIGQALRRPAPDCAQQASHYWTNTAVRAGPLVIGGLDDAFTGHADLDATIHAMAGLGGEPVLLSHSPDPFPQVPGSVRLMLAGHTHCGQIRLPFVGAVSYMSEFGDQYACGVVVEQGKTLVVGAGLGTSILPLRLGAVPDMWVITLTPAKPLVWWILTFASPAAGKGLQMSQSIH